MFDYSAGSRPSPWGSAASLFAHMAAVALLTSVTYGQVTAPEIKHSGSITYVSLSTPRPPAEAYAPPRTAPAAPKPQALAAVPVAPRVEALALEAPAPVLPRPLPSRLEPPAPIAPQERPAEPPITTGLFRIGSATAASAPRS